MPVGGPGKEEYVVIEMHYDNPKMVSGNCISCHHIRCIISHGIGNLWFAVRSVCTQHAFGCHGTIETILCVGLHVYIIVSLSVAASN